MKSVSQESQYEIASSSLVLQQQTQPDPSSNRNVNDIDDDPENILSDSLQTLYDYQPVTLTSAHSLYTHTHSTAPQITVTVRTPDTEAANWSLHASSVWVAAVEMASNIDLLRLDELSHRMGMDHGENRKIRVLELGAAAGLPSILIAKLYPNFKIIATDYPDPRIIQTLSQNIQQNEVQMNCHAVPWAWGSDPETLFLSLDTDGHGLGLDCSSRSRSSDMNSNRFDVIIAADTLWNPTLHDIFVLTLQGALRRDPESRVHLVAGLHTGRYTIQSFLHAAQGAGFRVVQIFEREVHHSNSTKARTRDWDVARAECEDEKDRRGWIIWMELAWEERGEGRFSPNSADRRDT
ncbi:hypothetical protein AGABI2DRAFT_205861 [Agaricus bisporus var. bisporus H97]|uniref:hypothetical protein n=1 Tax=Agaricus bisporus var. bisporus (strain H97 / ATCC MYA-4626 / FGSC 10389) TaxID=936046 RepID=UPI00029F6ED8|nr:hypothetical protein AGABI2DRAFT_205861 [Agaricus bisporus var. bisporus H97]EKV46546.1 hypothetical protein AGABI2DRAFT_205861 [Agaricus bisporus var. bisporus H97]